jgi:Ca-activated chloride channel family protein
MNLFRTSFEDTLTFGSPEWLWALLLLLPLGWLFIQAGRKREALMAKIIAPRLQKELAGRVSPMMRNLRMGILLIAFALLVSAAAQPRYGYDQKEIKSHGRDVIIAIDTSRSMLSTDTAPTRLGRAKLISQDLLNLLKGDRVGLIAFAGTAFLQAPLTLDKGAVLTSIEDLDTKTIPKGGTDISGAIQMAIAAFGKGEGTSRALVLMTDGEELETSGIEAAKEAASLGIKIFTIGFGSESGSLIPIQNEAGQNDFVRDENGNPVNSKLDAPRLTEIAKATGGFYLPYGQDVAKIIYDKGIVPIEAQENGSLTARKPIERYAWPAGAALALLMIWSLLGEGRRRRSALLSLIVCVSILKPTEACASGITDYSQGNYQGALQDFEQRIQKGSASPQVIFDAGAAAYKAGDYKKAAAYFSQAMTASNVKIREAATYNLANSLVRSGEAAQESEAKLSDWKNSLQHYETVLKSEPGNIQAKENRDLVKKLIEDQKKHQDQKNDQKKDQKDDQKKDKKDQQKNDQSQGDGKSDQQKNQDQKGSDKSQDSKDQTQKNQQNQNDPKGSQDKDQNSQDQKGGQPSPTPQNGQPEKQDGKSGATPTPSPASSPSPTPDQGKGEDAKNQQKPQQGTQGQEPQQPSGSPQDTGTDPQNGQGIQPTPTPGSTPADKKAGDLSGGQQGQKTEEQKAAEASAAEADESKDGKMSPNQARALLRSVQDEEQHVLNQQQRAAEQPTRDW